MSDLSSPSLLSLVTGFLVTVVGIVGVKVLERRLMGGTPAWVWRVAAYCWIAGGWAIVLLNEPIKTQAYSQPRAWAVVTICVLALGLFVVRSRLFDLPDAKLKAGVGCLRVDTQIDADADAVGLDCWFTMSIYLRNDGAVTTTVTNFKFFATWGGVEYEALAVRGLDHYRLKSFRPSDIGASSRYVDEYEPLFDFTLPCEISTTKSEFGWLRFFIRRFPLDAGNNAGLKKDVEIKLLALDKKFEPHVAFKMVLPNGECGPIEKIPEPTQNKALEQNTREVIHHSDNQPKPRSNIVMLDLPRLTLVTCDDKFVFREDTNGEWAIVVDFRNAFKTNEEIKGLDNVFGQLSFAVENVNLSRPVSYGFWLGQESPQATFERGATRTLYIGTITNLSDGRKMISTLDRRYSPPTPLTFSPDDSITVTIALFTQTRNRFYKECEVQLTPEIRIIKPLA